MPKKYPTDQRDLLQANGFWPGAATALRHPRSTCGPAPVATRVAPRGGDLFTDVLECRQVGQRTAHTRGL